MATYLQCPKCGCNERSTRNFVLLMSSCYHSLCRKCMDTLLVHATGPCPTCKQTVRRDEFRVQNIPDLAVEKELYIRSKFKKIFNLTEADFDSARAYNDYLESVEQHVFNLVHDVDVLGTQHAVDDFMRRHKKTIQANKSSTRKTDDDRFIDDCLQEYRDMRVRTDNSLQAERERLAVAESASMERRRARTEVIAEMARSDLPAQLIVDKHRREQTERTERERARRSAAVSAAAVDPDEPMRAHTLTAYIDDVHTDTDTGAHARVTQPSAWDMDYALAAMARRKWHARNAWHAAGYHPGIAAAKLFEAAHSALMIGVE